MLAPGGTAPLATLRLALVALALLGVAGISLVGPRLRVSLRALGPVVVWHVFLSRVVSSSPSVGLAPVVPPASPTVRSYLRSLPAREPTAVVCTETRQPPGMRRTYVRTRTDLAKVGLLPAATTKSRPMRHRARAADTLGGS